MYKDIVRTWANYALKRISATKFHTYIRDQNIEDIIGALDFLSGYYHVFIRDVKKLEDLTLLK